MFRKTSAQTSLLENQSPAGATGNEKDDSIVR